jgi:hypothetical protein
MKQWLALGLVVGMLAGCGSNAYSPALRAPGASIRTVQPSQAMAAAKIDLKVTGEKGKGYTTSYLLTVTKGAHKVEYTFDDTPMLDEDGSPARIENMAVKYDGKRISLNDVPAVEAAVAVLRGADAFVADAKQKMVRTAIRALEYDL